MAHRDIKPDNIMINEDMNQIKIIDIGEAEYSVLNSEVKLECVGTPLYFSPEMFALYLDQDRVI